MKAFSETISKLNSSASDLRLATHQLKQEPITVDINNEKWLQFTASKQTKFYKDSIAKTEKNAQTLLKNTTKKVDETLKQVNTHVTQSIESLEKTTKIKVFSVFTFQIISMAFVLFIIGNIIMNGLWDGLYLNRLWEIGTWWAYVLTAIIIIIAVVLPIYVIFLGIRELLDNIKWRKLY